MTHPALARIERANQTDALTHGFRVDSVDRDTFLAAFFTARLDPKIKAATSADVAERTGIYRLATAYGKVVGGYAVQVNSDFRLELCNLWGSGYGSRLVGDALHNGAEVLDCFDGFLPEFYARHGFVETSREPNWTPGEPDVVYMAAS
jgi:hypothetical protein